MDFHDNEEHEDYEDYEEQIDEIPYKKRHPAYRIVAGILILAFIALAMPQISLLLNNKLEFLKTRIDPQESPYLQHSASAVVSLEAVNEEHKTRRGTGFNISDTGLIISNRHIVDNATSIKIEFEDGKTFYSDNIQFVKNADIALIILDAQDLPVISLQTDNIPKPGAILSVIGNPLGFKQIILQGPVIGYLNLEKTSVPIMLLDIDCQPGNSGSPVINEQGQVVGIVYAVTTTEQDGKTRNNTLAYPLHYFQDYLTNALN